jgi:hypothetical protein
MQRIEPGIVVEAPDGKRGVTVDDFMSCCTNDETPVVFDGESGFFGTATDTLTVIGPEKPEPDYDGCGGGKGADCCVFLVCGPKGFSCERHGSLRYTLIFKEMAAKRKPVEPFPACKKFADS